MRVYIAGPITKGERTENVRNAILAGEQVRRAGHAPYVPHLDFLWGLLVPVAYPDWLALDHEWLKVCDALIRIPGESPGADKEVEWAMAQGIPVYFGVSSFLTTTGSGAPIKKALY